MKIKELVSALERFAPLPLQDGFDNAGLQIGLTDAEATGALLCLDVTEAVLDEAIALGYNVVISHHPLIFKGYKSITGRDYVERCILKAIKNDIVVYAAHTNLDNAPGGVNFKIAEKIGFEECPYPGSQGKCAGKADHICTDRPSGRRDGKPCSTLDAAISATMICAVITWKARGHSEPGKVPPHTVER